MVLGGLVGVDLALYCFFTLLCSPFLLFFWINECFSSFHFIITLVALWGVICCGFSVIALGVKAGVGRPSVAGQTVRPPDLGFGPTRSLTFTPPPSLQMGYLEAVSVQASLSDTHSPCFL